MAKGWHISKEFSHETNRIVCVCDWVGDAGTGEPGDVDDAWYRHRRERRNDPQPTGFNRKKFAYAPGNKLS